MTFDGLAALNTSQLTAAKLLKVGATAYISMPAIKSFSVDSSNQTLRIVCVPDDQYTLFGSYATAALDVLTAAQS